MASDHHKLSWARVDVAYAAMLVVVAVMVSEIPYWAADSSAGSGRHFIGYYFPAQDIASYFSFIQQAADGEILFRNNLTYIEHGCLLFQPVWLLLGLVMEVLDLSVRTVFAVWRILGAVVLISGFTCLSSVVLSSRTHRFVAVALCTLGGGSGWALWILSRFGVMDISGLYYLQNPAIDLGGPIHAFAQIAKNPHFSLPHGTYLFFWYFFLKADQGHRRGAWCAAACCMAILQGLIRQYDLLSMFAIIPAFIVLDSAVKKRFDVRLTVLRLLPIAAAAPVFAYEAILFSLHPAFSSSATQGAQPHVPLHWHVVSLGIAGILLLWRLYARPIRSSADILLLIWALTLFVLFHANGISSALSFSPQIAMSLMSPIILLGVSALPPSGAGKHSPRRSFAINAIVVLLACSTTPLFIVRAVDDVRASGEILYLTEDDLAAIAWLKDHSTPDNVILSNYHPSNKLAARLNRRFVVAHWAFSPGSRQLRETCEAILEGMYKPVPTVESLLANYSVDYVYVPAEYRETPSDYFESIPGVALSFESGDVRVFSVDTGLS